MIDGGVIYTSSGRTSGETDVGAEGARPYGCNLSGKRTEFKTSSIYLIFAEVKSIWFDLFYY